MGTKRDMEGKFKKREYKNIVLQIRILWNLRAPLKSTPNGAPFHFISPGIFHEISKFSRAVRAFVKVK